MFDQPVVRWALRACALILAVLFFVPMFPVNISTPLGNTSFSDQPISLWHLATCTGEAMSYVRNWSASFSGFPVAFLMLVLPLAGLALSFVPQVKRASPLFLLGIFLALVVTMVVLFANFNTIEIQGTGGLLSMVVIPNGWYTVYYFSAVIGALLCLFLIARFCIRRFQEL